jgi:hypothetical protein
MMLVLSLVVILASGCSSWGGTWTGTFLPADGPSGNMSLTIDTDSGLLTGSGTVATVPVVISLGAYDGDNGAFTLTATPAGVAINTWLCTATIDGDTMNGLYADNVLAVSGTFTLTKQ